MMKLIFFLALSDIMACPGCAGSMNNPKESYIVYILMVFILLIYFPMMHLFRVIYKYRNINEVDKK